MAASDPFYVIRDDVNDKIERVKVRHSEFTGLTLTSSVLTDHIREVRKNIFKDLKDANKKIKGLHEAVRKIEQDRLNFSYITDDELKSRKDFIKSSKRTLGKIKNEVEKSYKRLEKQKNDNSMLYNNSHEDPSLLKNNDFIGSQEEQTKMIMKQREEDMTELGHAVNRVELIAVEIKEELTSQNKLLDDLGEDMDKHHEKMNFVMGKLSKLLKTKDKCQIWSIVILFLILVILIAMVIWT